MRLTLLLLIALGLSGNLAQAQQWSDLDKVFGSGAIQKGNTYRVERVRRDLQIQNSNGMLIPPEMGLVSTAVFSRETVQGDICLDRSEFDSVINDLREGNISITSLGVRFAGTDPGIYFLQFQGKGDVGQLGRIIKRAFDELGKVRFISEGLNRTGKLPIVDWKAVSVELGLTLNPVGNSTVMRSESTHALVSFGGCPCGRTMVMGRIETGSARLQSLIDELRAGHISVTAIAGSATGDYSVDFEAEGDAVRLAAALNTALAEASGHPGER